MAKVDLMEPGRYVVGTYAGVQEGREWTPPGESQPVPIPPKLGVTIEDGETIAIRIDTLADVAAIAPGVQKGDSIAVPVRTYPKRNGRGVQDVWAGIAQRDRDDWR